MELILALAMTVLGFSIMLSLTLRLAVMSDVVTILEY